MESFLSRLPKIPTGQEMAQWDQAAVKFGLPENLLMENAGREAFKVIESEFGPLKNKIALIFMGSGNNGGDAAVVARLMQDAGAKTVIALSRAAENMRGLSAYNLSLAEKDGAIIMDLSETSLPDVNNALEKIRARIDAMPAIIVDGLLGTGFCGQLSPHMQALVQIINNFSAYGTIPVISLDIPSGLDAAQGKYEEIVKADLIVTFAAPKLGCILPLSISAKIICCDIGMPKAIETHCPSTFRLLDGTAVDFLPDLPVNSYKNRFGHVTVIGGADQYPGAAQLSAAAALRSGAGLVSVCAPNDNAQAIRAHWPEIMVLGAGPGNNWPQKLSSSVYEIISQSSAFVIGPGMSRSENAAIFLEEILSLPERPKAVIDADALVLLAKNPPMRKFIRESDILTPHPGEAAALLGVESKEVQKDRFAALEKLCGIFPAAVVLKGAGTLVGRGEGMRMICPYDIAQLAMAGAGDALAGCIGAKLASAEYSSWDAAETAGAGVIIHAIAGLMLAKKFPVRGDITSDLIRMLPHVPVFIQKMGCRNGRYPWPK